MDCLQAAGGVKQYKTVRGGCGQRTNILGYIDLIYE
jgi:hypothetical protein